MADVIEQTVMQLEADVAAFRQRMDPAAADATVAEAVTKFRAKFESEGLTGVINVAPEKVLKDFERQVRGQYDEARRTDAAALKAALDAAEAGMATTIATLARLPDPIVKSWNATASADLHEVRRMRIGQEMDRVERRLSGKTLPQILAVYEASDDERDEVVSWFIESQAASGWPDVARQHSDDDATAMLRLTAAMTARQLARIEKHHPDVLKAADRLKALRSATLDSLFRHLLTDGRGLALVR